MTPASTSLPADRHGLKAVLVLEDGSIIHGNGFGSEKTIKGELVFNTGMTGYQEALTDPSYNGQILMMTYPLIGNYGVNPEHCESEKIQAEGFVVREICDTPSLTGLPRDSSPVGASHRLSTPNGARFTEVVPSGTKTIDEFLKEQDIPGISEIDTRSLTIKTRQSGTLRAILKTYQGNISSAELDVLRYEAKVMPFPDKYNLVGEVSCKETFTINHSNNGSIKIVLIDCGSKMNIIRELVQRGCTVIRAPYNITADEINKLSPDGILVSNGPGDPAHPEIMDTVVKTVREIKDDYPIMGICLGHQILSLAFGARTYKLKFGHRGANQPVKFLSGNKIYITSQNHGFAVDPDSIPSDIEITALNVNDGTVEAMQHKKLPIFSVQYHPEASPGPWDSKYLFDRFITICHTS